MRNRISCAVALVLVVSFRAFARGGVVFGLEMDQDPVYQGCTVSPGSTPGNHSVDAGLLTINSPSYYEIYAPSNVMNLISNTSGWAINARFKFGSGSGSYMTFWVWDGTEVNVINVNHTESIVYGGAIGHDLVFPFNIDTNFHTYRIEAIGVKVKMLVDGAVAFDTVHQAPGGGSHVIFFGDGAESFSTVSVWDYYRLSSPVPEPAVGLLLCAAILAMPALCRRRGHVR